MSLWPRPRAVLYTQLLQRTTRGFHAGAFRSNTGCRALTSVVSHCIVQPTRFTERRVQLPFFDKAVVMLDLNARIAYASTYFCDLVCAEYDDVAGTSFLDFVFQEDRDLAGKLLQKNNSANGSWRFRLMRKDGTPIFVNVRGAALYTAGGELYAISIAITESQPNESHFHTETNSIKSS